MSALAEDSGQDRLLAFEVAGSLYALPIGCVVEVAEVAPLACIPTLPERVGGVMNHHGDALPVIQRGVLLGVDEDSLAEPAHVLAVTARSGFIHEPSLVIDFRRGTLRSKPPAECMITLSPSRTTFPRGFPRALSIYPSFEG